MDKGNQFKSALWSSLLTFMEIVHRHVTVYRHKSNDMLERFHLLESASRDQLHHSCWFDCLPLILFNLYSSNKKVVIFCPVEIVLWQNTGFLIISYIGEIKIQLLCTILNICRHLATLLSYRLHHIIYLILPRIYQRALKQLNTSSQGEIINQLSTCITISVDRLKLS